MRLLLSVIGNINVFSAAGTPTEIDFRTYDGAMLRLPAICHSTQARVVGHAARSRSTQNSGIANDDVALHTKRRGAGSDPKANRKQPRALGKDHDKARHLVESLLQSMKVFRRVATRFDKLDCMFQGFVHLATIKKGLY